MIARNRNSYLRVVGIVLTSSSICLSGCKLAVNKNSKSEDADSSGSSSLVLSYDGASGTQGTVGQKMKVTPKTLSSGTSKVEKCEIKAGSTNVSKFPSSLSIDAATCIISGTPTASLAQTEFTVQATTSQGVTASAAVTLSVGSGTVDHLEMVSGNSQSVTVGSLAAPLVVRAVDSVGVPVTSGVTLSLFRLMGIDQYAPTFNVTTDSSGIASFPVYAGSAPNSWRVIPVGTTLPDVAASGGTSIPFSLKPTSTGLGTFAAKVDTSAGTGPNHALVADFNGDNKMDIVLASQNAAKVTVLLGAGNGTFSAPVDYATGSSLFFVTAADINRDGKLDLIAGNSSASTISILLGSGNGTFAAKTDIAAGTNPNGMAIVDLNKDGNLDLVVANRSVSTLSVFMGTGGGSFAAKVDYATTSAPWDIAAADFNGDDKIDVAVSYNGGTVVSVLPGNGDGTLGAKADLAVGSTPYGINVGDFNGDGKMDIVVGNYSSNTVSLLLGNGNGTFAAKADFATASGPFGRPNVADFNGDGKLDLVVPGYGASAFSVLLGNGSGSFAAKVDYAVGSSPCGIGVGDLNGDGKLDVVVPNRSSNTMSVLLGT